MQIAIITDSFPPIKNSGAVQIRDLSLEFISHGHQVIVITPSSDINSSCIIEDMRGVQVLRLKAPTIRNIGYVRRTIREFVMPFVMLKCLKHSHVYNEELDGVITYAPSIFFGPIG